MNKKLAGLDFSAMQPLMTGLVESFIEAHLVASNPMTEKILAKLDLIRSVADMAALVCLSPRQLQRTLKHRTGFASHDLLKVLRVQQSFRQQYLDLYADQSHYIHSFRKVTGLTPGQYTDTFNV
jgi:AraC-like DNA-binding protein